MHFPLRRTTPTTNSDPDPGHDEGPLSRDHHGLGHADSHHSPEVPRAALRRRALRRLLVPLLVAAVATAAAPGWSLYRIKHGDTLEAIAKRYHTTVARLIAANNLPGNGDLIYAGETLKVPTGAATTSTRTVVVRVQHRVVVGDSLIKIARKYGVDPSVVAAANHLPPSKIVRLGAVLTIPVRRTVTVASTGPAKGATSSANSFAGRTYPNAVVAAAARNRAILAARPAPSKAYVRQLITRTAKRNGVDPALALAVAWQESGFKQHKVSVANAIGVMQVIPSTGAWASAVVGRQLNLLDVKDNVLAGVVLLRVLTKTERNLGKAVAGYYQGLASVRKNGMYADTKRYVANVLALRSRFS